ncbi:hypothetical protein [Chryseobacterium taeanense]|uniref:hypothetical protein n=1 Tax=Chryseobacterium taeanense TaxID=311334 RepID=UPI0035AEE423
MSTKKNQSARILNAQTQLLNFKIQQLNMINNLTGALGDNNHYVAIKDIFLSKFDPNDHVSVSIFFGGENQKGSSTLKILKTAEQSKFISQSTENINIGECKDLAGQILDIESSITDTNGNAEQNDTILTIKINIGLREVYKDQHTITVGEAGTSSFTHYITFY